MENASKALLIAAAVLVVIILVAIGMKIYSSTTGTGKVATDTGKTISDKTGEATDIATYEITGKRPANPNIKYYEGETNNPKSQENAVPGDTIKIADEKFIIFSKTDKEIKAMPYNNIELKTDSPKQNYYSNTMYIGFYYEFPQIQEIGSVYTIASTDFEAQQYVSAYKETLNSYGANEVKVELPKYTEIRKLSNNFLNPGWKSSYWIGSYYKNSVGRGSVYAVKSDGSFASVAYGNYGIRPIIIIPI